MGVSTRGSVGTRRSVGVGYISLDKQLKTLERRLRALPKALSGKGGGPIRQALFQAAKIVEKEAEQRAPKATGRLKRAIAKGRVKNPQTRPGRPVEVYRIGVARGLTRYDPLGAYYWHMLEFGTKFQPAQPFLGPALKAKQKEAVDRYATVLARKIALAERKVRNL